MRTNPFSSRRKAKREEDKIWMTREFKYRGLCQIVASPARPNTMYVMVAHFQQSLQEMGRYLQAQGVRFTECSTAFDRSTARARILQPEPGSILLVLSGLLPELAGEAQPETAQAKAQISIIGIERYPMRYREKQLEELAESIPHPATLCLHGSLDEPLFQLFGGQSVTGMVAALHMPQDSCLSSSMISRSIERAQIKIEKRITNEMAAISGEEWVLKNMPDHAAHE
jgi:preprotein translocase subunit SecA